MLRKLRLLLSTILLLPWLGVAPAQGQSTTAPATTDMVLRAPDVGRILPPAVFFRGQSAPVQSRNSGGIKYADGMMVLAALIDNSGYSTSVQQKYQAYFITEIPIEVSGHALAPGAYGVGFVDGHFGVMDIGDHDLFSVDATHDAAFKRPTPLQVIADDTPGHYRLYAGRDYVKISRADTGK